jgi:hypothetical protein
MNTDPDPIIARFLATVSREYLGEICGVDRTDGAMTIGWVEMPDNIENVITQWESEPVFHVQFGKYAYLEHDHLEPGDPYYEEWRNL